MMTEGAKTPHQLVFNLTPGPSYDPGQFLVSRSNTHAHSMVDAWPVWPSPILLLIGPAGAGKSHLGSIWASRAGARIIRSGDPLDIGNWKAPVIALVENVDTARFPESDLFHLLNFVGESGGWLMLTARTSPAQWAIGISDLRSRLRLTPVATILPPDDTLMFGVIKKLFSDRQIEVEEDVVAYASRHCERSLAAVSAFVEAIDETALAANRRITRPLAAHILSELSKYETGNPGTGLQP